MIKSDKIRKLVVGLFIALFWIFILAIVGYYGLRGLVSYELHDMWVQQTKISKFEDFSSIEDDFKTVADIAFEYKADILSSEIQWLFIDVNEDEDAIYASTYESDIELNEEQKKAVKNVYYAFWNEGSPNLITMIVFLGDNDLLFWCEDGRHGIVYCPSDSLNMENIERRMGKDAGIVKLSDCWYQVIRHPDN